MLNPVNKNELIKSYGFIEKVVSNKALLREYLELAAKIGGTSSAYISLIDNDKQYILSQHKINLDVIPKEQAICNHTIRQKEILIIEDTKSDDRTKELPLVIEDKWNFYAGIPLINAENHCIGAFCIIDKKSKKLTKQQVDILNMLAKRIIDTLDNQRDLVSLIKKINADFEPTNYTDLYCLQAELTHLSKEIIKQNDVIRKQKIKLEEVNESLKAFAHVAAHDLRAPLRTIKSFIQLMEEDLSQNAVDFNKEYMHLIKNAANDMDKFILDLLTLAKAGHDDGSRTLISIVDVLEQIKMNLKNEIEKTNATIIFPDNDLTISCNKTKIIQLFQNLISNGIKYCSDERLPEIKITANKIKDRVFIKITDNGIGMDNTDEIFKPFKRLNNTENFEGTGIGLATCKKVLDSIDANYSVQSQLDKGTTFYFDFPDNV